METSGGGMCVSFVWRLEDLWIQREKKDGPALQALTPKKNDSSLAQCFLRSNGIKEAQWWWWAGASVDFTKQK